jgi:alanyl-tRNA synthetase
MKSLEIRKKFFDFFEKNGHTAVSSSSLIPAQDPTLLFTNAGMNQFKDLFLGLEKRNYTRAVTIQKCMRAGGKHNDLDQVGFTKRHLTFFEMMGNFSFGDYFKEDAINFAWNFLTKEMELPKDRLYPTVFREDDQAFDIWHKTIGIPKEKIGKLDEKDNFWQMGDTGPCGPCTEIYYDRGSQEGCQKSSCKPGCSCDRFLEIWNLVFMQYDRQSNGELVPLKQTGVDTGMGLERLCVVKQNKDSVFNIDLFQDIIAKIEELTGLNYQDQDHEKKAAFHVLSDHVRAACFALADGCAPSNEGRGYVLRKIVRRAALFEQKLVLHSIFAQLADSLIDSMQDIYPELATSKEYIVSVLSSEIEKFATNLVRGQAILEKYFNDHQSNKIINGEQAFKLYDTFGFPIEIVELIASEQNFKVDMLGFEAEMEKQRKQSGKKEKTVISLELNPDLKTVFVGYEQTSNQSKIIAIVDANTNQATNVLKSGTIGWVVTESSPFFVECGGQISDQGVISFNQKATAVTELKKVNQAICAKIQAVTDLAIGDQVESIVDQQIRTNTMKNHTATHLLQAALIELLGKQVRQSGSVVTPDYLRFDFTYHQNLTAEQITKIEARVNNKICENICVKTHYTSYKKALEMGAIAIFGEKYNPEDVRVIDVPGFSTELCGGTHVCSTGDIGVFKITEVSALSAGNRRIVALTGPKAVELFQENFNSVKSLSQEFKVKPNEVVATTLKQQELLKEAQNNLAKIKKQLWLSQLDGWQKQVKVINNLPVLSLVLQDFDANDLREIAQALNQKQAGLYILVSNQSEQKSSFICLLDAKLNSSFDLKAFANKLKLEFNLRGGGKDMVIQGGGPKINANFKDLVVKII